MTLVWICLGALAIGLVAGGLPGDIGRALRRGVVNIIRDGTHHNENRKA
jgi:hypothetical protein